jgi:hypothetical protein
MSDEDHEKDDGTVPLAEWGFRAACERLHTTGPAVNIPDAFVALAEVLWWASRSTRATKPEMARAIRAGGTWTRTEALARGAVRSESRWASAAGHVWRRPGAELGSLVLGVSRLGEVTELVWRPGAERATEPRHPDREGRRVYEQALQERPVRETIDAPHRWFSKAADRSP